MTATPATLQAKTWEGMTNNQAIIILERPCAGCEGDTCTLCGGTGLLLTDEGTTVLQFMRRHWFEAKPSGG